MIRVAGIYDIDLNFLDIIVGPEEPTFQEVLSDPGSGQFTVSNQDLAIARTGWSTLLAYGNIVVMHDTQTDKWFAWIIEKKDRTVVASGEVSDQKWTISGRGIAALLQDAGVYPEYGLKRSSADQRHFSFASKTGNWYKSSEWSAPVGSTWQSSTAHKRRPKGWPDPTAQWIWSTDPDVSSPAGTVYFRKSFTLTAPTRVSFYCTVDNKFDLYVDGELVMSGKSWYHFQRFDTDLDPGTHWVAIKGVNDPPPSGTGLNPGGAILVAYEIDPVSEKKLSRILHTDTSWLCRPYGSQPPGWDPGDVMGTLIVEARARGVDSMMHFHPLTAANQDSAGVTWPASAITTRAFDVGTDYLDALDQIAELSCDWLARWDQAGDIDHKLNLDLFVKLGVDRSIYDPTHGLDPVMLRRGFNLVESSYSGDASGLQSALLIRTNDGWIEEVNSGTGIRRRESYLSLGSSTNDTHTVNVAVAAFDKAGVPQESWSAKALDASGHLPFHDFSVGDWVLGPDEDGDLVKQRVIAITLTQDSDGNVFYIPQLNDTRHAQAKRTRRWLKSMAKGTAAGRVANASPHAAQAGAVDDSSPVEIPISHAGALTSNVSTPYTPWSDATLIEVMVSLGTTASTDTILTVYQNGSSIGTVTIPAGQDTASGDFNDGFTANVDKLTVQVTTIGTGAADLTAQARFH